MLPCRREEINTKAQRREGTKKTSKTRLKFKLPAFLCAFEPSSLCVNGFQSNTPSTRSHGFVQVAEAVAEGEQRILSYALSPLRVLGRAAVQPAPGGASVLQREGIGLAALAS